VRFSIIVTCYNQRLFISEAVESALSQDYAEREVIIVNDGSTDGSLGELEKYSSRVQLLSTSSNRGAIAARNLGATQARGEFLVFLDGDDILMPWALNVYEILIEKCNPTVILAKTTWFRGNPPTMDHSVPNKITFVAYDSLIRKDRPVGLTASAYVVDRGAFWQVGGWTPEFFQLDLQDLSVKLGLHPTIVVCSPATALYRIHERNSILCIPPFLVNVRRLLEKERAGAYPGGTSRRFNRKAWFGGLVLFWVRRSLRAGLYKDAMHLMAVGWINVLFAMIQRSTVWILGRKAVDELPLPSKIAPIRSSTLTSNDAN